MSDAGEALKHSTLPSLTWRPPLPPRAARGFLLSGSVGPN